MATCTYAKTGANFMSQEWYECITCGIVEGSGVCAPCAASCHKGHQLSPPRTSSFYCDCGAGGCAAMAPPVAAPAPAPVRPGPAVTAPVAKRPLQRHTRTEPPKPALGVVRAPTINSSLALPRPAEYRPEDLRVDANAAVIRLPPYYYLHMLDTNENVTAVIVGPETVTRRDHERIVLGPRKMLMIPPACYCVIADPVVRHASTGQPVVERGQFKVSFGELEVRRTAEPFFLYPGESVAVGVTPLTVVPENCALRLRAQRRIEPETAGGKAIEAGAEWYFVGPGTYVPHVAVLVVESVASIKLEPTQALRLRCRNNCTDYEGTVRTSGEEWLVRDVTLYLPNVEEIVVGLVNPLVLTVSSALHLRALRGFTDVFGVERKAGQEWLVTCERASTYIPGVFEELVALPRAIVLSNRQYCVVQDPVDPATGLPQLGRAVARVGPTAFFLHPHETLRAGVQEVEVLAANQALLVRAVESFRDETDRAAPVERCAGDRWLVTGPAEYFPPCSVEILKRRSALPLAASEGVYVRDLSGAVYSVIGRTYLLRENEELWEKDLQPGVEALLVKYGGAEPRDKTRVVCFQVPFNAACQVYDYRMKTARVVFGPELVMLQPDEQLTVLNLSGGKPKRSGQIRDIVMRLGPDFTTDILTVETSDHARLDLRLSYGWFFDVAHETADGALLFNIPDFVGDMCKAIASRVRGAVAGVSFDAFHKASAEIINRAVFGATADGVTRTELRFPSNKLVVNAVDIQSVEPVDKSTRDSLMQSVQMAISITTDALEAKATNAAKKKEQEAMAELSRQRIRDEALVEEARQALIQLKAESRAVETTGTATAEAQARAQAQRIVGESEVELAQLRAKAANIFSAAELERMAAFQDAELAHRKDVDSLELDNERRRKELEATKFRSIVESIGRETIKTIANAGPEMQAKLLAGLGLQGLVVTDGQSPLNFFNMAESLTAGAAAAGRS